MTLLIGDHIDLQKSEIQNVKIQNLSADPSGLTAGDKGLTWFNTTDNVEKYWNGSAVVRKNGADMPDGSVNTLELADNAVTSAKIADLTIVNGDISATAAIALSKLATDPLARANHTGTQTASTISDFTTVRDQQRLDQHAAPTADINLNSRKITSLADPTADTDAANKRYVDSARAGLRLKDSVRVATTANITLSGTQTIDGVAVVANDRVLVKNQTTASTNGIYIVAAGAWTRATDADSAAEVTDGATTFVQQGTTQADTSWAQINNITTLGTDNQQWVQQGAAVSYSAGNGLTAAGNTFSVLAANGTITVTGSGVSVGTIGAAQIADGSVGTAELADASVTGGTGAGAKIATGTITDANVSGTAAIAVSKIAGAVRKFAVTVGDGTATSIVINHALGSADVVETVKRVSDGAKVMVGVTYTDANNLTLTFSSPPAANSIRVVVTG